MAPSEWPLGRVLDLIQSLLGKRALAAAWMPLFGGDTSPDLSHRLRLETSGLGVARLQIGQPADAVVFSARRRSGWCSWGRAVRWAFLTVGLGTREARKRLLVRKATRYPMEKVLVDLWVRGFIYPEPSSGKPTRFRPEDLESIYGHAPSQWI